MSNLLEEASLLRGDDEQNEKALQRPARNRWLLWPQQLSALVYACLLSSLTYNLIQWQQLRQEIARPDMCRSNYTGLAYDTPKKYESNWGKNDSEADEFWDSLDASPVVIALTYEEAASKYGLGPSAPFPWDNEKGLYYIKAFHHLHCLKIIRKAVKSFDRTGAWEGSREHLYHCLNTVRQDLMCKSDDTIMTTGNKPHVIGDDQTVWCRNWDSLVDWAQDPQRHACYRILDDDKPVQHSLELYAYCPKDSPHYETMQAYFNKHGHKDAFGKQYGEAQQT
ncbi:unnamed protein product [Periconia digitata]|uniref:Uncharacterized protein n=1 Tax=Periconia digitata TaxID=1303443 RepID=A0A9W4UIV9_9PLEO|nr:unnamed protein product [Periconia digitata]